MSKDSCAKYHQTNKEKKKSREKYQILIEEEKSESKICSRTI